MSTEITTSAIAISSATDLKASVPEGGAAIKGNAREGKPRARGKKGAKADKKVDVFEGLHSDEVDRLHGIASAMNRLDRAKTKDAFERGRMLETAFEILPVEKTFAAWIAQTCDFTARTARFYRSIPSELCDYEDRAVAGAVPATILFELAREAVTADQVEAVLERFEAGERLTVSKVKRQLRGDDAEAVGSDPVDPLDLGGSDGLARLVRECLRSDLAEMRAEIGSIAKVIEETLAATPADRQIKKGVFIDAVFRHARLAAALLGRAVFSRMEDPIYGGRMIEKRPPVSSGWMRAHALLDRLGNKEAYPPVEELRAWLEGEVLPTLDWMTAKGVRPPLSIGAAPTADAAAPIDAPTADVEASVSADTAPALEASAPVEVEWVDDVDVAPVAKIEVTETEVAPIEVAAAATDTAANPAASKPARTKAAKAKPTGARRTYKTATGETKVATRPLTNGELKAEKAVNRMLNMMMR